MEPSDIERRRLVCIEAASRIVAGNLNSFLRDTHDPTRVKLGSAVAVRDLAQMLYHEADKIH